MKQYRVKRPDGSFDPQMYATPSAAVAAAAELVDIPWREGCEAVARLDNNMTTLHVFKDRNTSAMVGVDTVNVKPKIEYELHLSFTNERERYAALEVVKANFELVTHSMSDAGKLGDLLAEEEKRK